MHRRSAGAGGAMVQASLSCTAAPVPMDGAVVHGRPFRMSRICRHRPEVVYERQKSRTYPVSVDATDKVKAL